MVKVAVIQQKNTCHDRVFFQKDETSSMANRRPPTGAPKAEAIPAKKNPNFKSTRFKNDNLGGDVKKGSVAERSKALV